MVTTPISRDETIAALRKMIRKLDAAAESGEWTLDTARMVRLAEDITAWMDARPRRWEMPAEPGPEVTHVRDNAGRVWRCPALGYENPDQWAGYWRTLDNQLAKDWPGLVSGFGPLTDVTADYRKDEP